LRCRSGVTVLDHVFNKGKGAALKTGIEHVLLNHARTCCVVTADADGQHAALDILEVMRETIVRNAPVLGVRTFERNVPFRSRFGNAITRVLFQIVYRTRIRDTQTGLRGIPVRLARDLLAINADHYNFEFEALIQLVRKGPVFQRSIQTIYDAGNISSHFNPVLDSVRIYAIILRHVSTIFFIGVFDFTMFMLLSTLGSNILWSLIGARCASSFIYFAVAKWIVFRSSGNVFREAILYALLVGTNIVLLWPFIEFIHEDVGASRSFAMLLGYAMMFGSNFLWQYIVIFNRREKT